LSTSIQGSAGLTVERARRYLRSQLGTRWKTGDRLPTIEVLAESMGVGRVNALRAVQLLAKEGYLESRPRLGTVVVSEMPGAVKRASGRTGDSREAPLHNKTVRVLSPSIRFDSFCRAAVASVGRGLDELGARVEVIDCTHEEPLMTNLTMHDAVDAVVAINPNPTALQHGCDDQLVTVITTDADYTMSRAGRYDIVGVDSAQGGFLAGQWLRNLNIGPVGFIGAGSAEGDGFDRTSTARLEAMVHGLGTPIDKAHCWRAARYTVEFGAMLVQPYLETPDRPAALFAASDELAVGFIYGMIGRGLMPGRDYHIVGFDGQSRGRGLACGPLTTVQVSMEHMGEVAVDMLLERFVEPDRPVRRVRLGCELFEGRTAIPRR